MKVSELLLEMEYDPKRGIMTGDVKKWLEKAGIKSGDKEFFNKALKELKKTHAWDVITEMGVKYDSTDRELANGTLSFNMFDEDKNRYKIYGNGQIRIESKKGRYGISAPTRLKTPKPTMVVGDPLKSILKTWENSLWELIDKHKKKLDAAEKRMDKEWKERNKQK